jgi:signal transduction histidine kinase
MLPAIKRLATSALSSIGVVLSLAAILVVLAVLQYHWTGQVSEAERERMLATLSTSTNQFRQEFNADLQQLGLWYQPENAVLGSLNWRHYADSSTELLNGVEGHLVKDLYLWISSRTGSSQLQVLNRQARIFEPVSWPPRLESVRDRFERTFSAPNQLPADMRPISWTFFPRIPLMLHPLAQPPAGRGSAPPGALFAGCLMLELNLESMRRELLPELAVKYFGGPDGLIYQVAIIAGKDPAVMIYQSDPSLFPADFASSDARIGLLGNPRGRFGRRGAGGGGDMRPPPDESRGFPAAPFDPDFPRSGRARGGGPVLLQDNEGADWELAVKHRRGSLEAVVAGTRRRNLAVGFGILLLLASSMGLIIAFAQRMRRLARLQMDFVAGVSHELRTPLAVICSAGDNLADSAVADSGRQVRQYGELIRNEGWKLTRMVEQILHVASVQSGRRRYSLRPDRIERILEMALGQVQPMLEADGFSVEKQIDPDLPGVNADADALLQTIQNLIQNAVKYSGESRWLGIRAGIARSRHGAGVQLVVEDRGIGIEPADLPHIFDPFYRGRKVTDSQIHGAGLGLFMVREAIVAMGGTISVKSTPGKGSAFTIHLPALSPGEAAGLLEINNPN